MRKKIVTLEEINSLTLILNASKDMPIDPEEINELNSAVKGRSTGLVDSFAFNLKETKGVFMVRNFVK